MSSRLDLPVVALDMDEVLFPFAQSVFDHYRDEVSEPVDINTLHNYHHFHHKWNIDIEETIQRIVDYFTSTTHAQAEPLTGSKQAIERIAKRAKIIVVTARQTVATQPTLNWLDDNYGSGLISEVYMCNHYPADGSKPVSKAEVCKQQQVVAFADDSLSNVVEVANSNVPSAIFGDYSWNRVDAAGSDFDWLTGWNELESWIYEQL